MTFNISIIYETGIGIKANLVLLGTVKTDGKCIKPHQAKGPRIMAPERRDEGISV